MVRAASPKEKKNTTATQSGAFLCMNHVHSSAIKIFYNKIGSEALARKEYQAFSGQTERVYANKHEPWQSILQLKQIKGDNLMLEILNQFYERLLMSTKQVPLAQTG